MDYPVLVILAVLGIGLLFVVLPVVLTTLSEHREPRRVVCPATGGPATISVDAGRAARTAAFGRVRLSVEKCTLWPERQSCSRACLSPLVQAPAPPVADQS
jgi:hypothetical protein